MTNEETMLALDRMYSLFKFHCSARGYASITPLLIMEQHIYDCLFDGEHQIILGGDIVHVKVLPIPADQCENTCKSNIFLVAAEFIEPTPETLTLMLPRDWYLQLPSNFSIPVV